MSDGGIYPRMISSPPSPRRCSAVPNKVGDSEVRHAPFGALAEKMPGCSIINPDKIAGDTPPLLDVRCDKGKGGNLVFSKSENKRKELSGLPTGYRIHNWL